MFITILSSVNECNGSTSPVSKFFKSSPFSRQNLHFDGKPPQSSNVEHVSEIRVQMMNFLITFNCAKLKKEFSKWKRNFPTLPVVYHLNFSTSVDALFYYFILLPPVHRLRSRPIDKENDQWPISTLQKYL